MEMQMDIKEKNQTKEKKILNNWRNESMTEVTWEKNFLKFPKKSKSYITWKTTTQKGKLVSSPTSAKFADDTSK